MLCFAEFFRPHLFPSLQHFTRCSTPCFAHHRVPPIRLLPTVS